MPETPAVNVLPLRGRRIALGVTGSIAAFKAADLASKLRQAGAEVEVVMTRAATEFVTPLTFHSLTGRAVIVANLTLMAGFGVLLLSRFKPVQQFGELISVTVANCLIATVFMQPALLKVAGLSRKQKAALRAPASRAVVEPEPEV